MKSNIIELMLIEPYKGKYSSVLLFGPPGVGKGTLGAFLASGGDQYHLASGNIFHSLPLKSEAGRLFERCWKRGDLVPDEFTIEIWKRYVEGLIATNLYNPLEQHLLLDGIPRTLEQAKLIEQWIKVRHIIVLESNNRPELIRRIEERARTEGHIDEIDPAAFDRRIAHYEEEIAKLLDFYPSHLISKVNGEQRPLEVLRDVLVRLSHLLCRPANLRNG